MVVGPSSLLVTTDTIELDILCYHKGHWSRIKSTHSLIALSDQFIYKISKQIREPASGVMVPSF